MQVREVLRKRNFDEDAAAWDLLKSLKPPPPEGEESNPHFASEGEGWVEERAEEQLALVRTHTAASDHQ